MVVATSIKTTTTIRAMVNGESRGFVKVADIFFWVMMPICPLPYIRIKLPLKISHLKFS